MKTFTERLNFSDTQDSELAIKIEKWCELNHYDTLRDYCADHDIALNTLTDEEFDAAGELMSDHGQHDKSTDVYYFWIDA